MFLISSLARVACPYAGSIVSGSEATPIVRVCPPLLLDEPPLPLELEPPQAASATTAMMTTSRPRTLRTGRARATKRYFATSVSSCLPFRTHQTETHIVGD